MQQYHDLACHFKQYVEGLSPKIDTICDKENYRTHLKEQHLNSIRKQLQRRKHTLEAVLEERMNPKSSENGKLVEEVEELQKLESTYKKMMAAAEEQVKEAKNEIKELEEEVRQRKIISKYSIQSAFVKTDSGNRRMSTEGEAEERVQQRRKLKHRDSRNSLISRVRNGLTSKAERQL